MSSNEENETTEKCSSEQANSDIDDKLKELSCPFTWGMENVIENRNKLLDANENRFETVLDIQEHFPEFVLIYHLMLAYENVMSNDLISATKSINEAEESLADIKKKGTLKNVETVLEHIFVATKCHVFQKLGQATELDELLDGICHIEDMNEVQSAMLSGCQCLAWSLYYATDNLMAIKSAEEAIEHDASNGKWHFLLGKNHRRLRRRHNSIGVQPNRQEVSAFEVAFRLTPNVLFGVSLAQMYRESLNYDMANITYKKVYDLKPTCCKVRLQLALGFIRAKQCVPAKDCLDYVRENMPDSNIYTHYMGIYEEKCNHDFKAALPYYKSTTENSNFAAEWQYVDCRKRVEQDWDPLPYLLTLIEKYDKDSDHVTQGINIQIGWHYLFEMNDVLSACPYLTKAIEISPAAKILREHYLLFPKFGKMNIYHALREEIELALKSRTKKYDDAEIVMLKGALDLCQKNYKSFPPLSESYRNQVRNSGFSSGRGNNKGGERSGASSRGFPRNYPQRSSGDARKPPERFSGQYRGRDDASRRSNEHVTRGNQEKHLAKTFRDEKDRVSTDHVRGRGIRMPPSSKPRDENDDSEADASCSLVKAVRKLNI